MENLPKALVGVHLLRWIATYPVDKVICSLNNWVLVYKLAFRDKRKEGGGGDNPSGGGGGRGGLSLGNTRFST